MLNVIYGILRRGQSQSPLGDQVGVHGHLQHPNRGTARRL